MRDRIYLSLFLLASGAMLYAGRGLLTKSALVTWGLTFAGTTAAAVLATALYRVQLALRASRLELAREQAELNFALEVQKALFPRQFPLDGGLEFSAVCVPARGIAGDYYDVIQLTDGRLALAIADISGKGISAAILMSNLHAVLRTVVEAGHPALEICRQLNRHLYRITDSFRFATFFYAEWSTSDRRLCYINAGHNAPIVVGGACRSLRLREGGVPLGIFVDAEYQVGQARLEPGDLVVLYSDGVTEASSRADEQFGERRLEEVVTAHCQEPLDAIQRQVLEAVRAWSGPEPEDDMTLLLVRAKPAEEVLR